MTMLLAFVFLWCCDGDHRESKQTLWSRSKEGGRKQAMRSIFYVVLALALVVAMALDPAQVGPGKDISKLMLWFGYKPFLTTGGNGALSYLHHIKR